MRSAEFISFPFRLFLSDVHCPTTGILNMSVYGSRKVKKVTVVSRKRQRQERLYQTVTTNTSALPKHEHFV